MDRGYRYRHPASAALAVALALAGAVAALALGCRSKSGDEERFEGASEPPPSYPAARCPTFTFPAPAEPPIPDATYYRPPSCEPPKIPLALSPHASPLWKRLAAACEGGSNDACFELGRGLAGGVGGMQDARQGLSLVYDACMKGHAKACAVAGGAYASGVGAPYNLACSDMLRKRACDGGDADACVNLGRSLKFAWSGLYDPARGQALLDKYCPGGVCPSGDDYGSMDKPDDIARCEQGDYLSCENATSKLPPDKQVAPVLLACAAGSSRGCWMAGRYLKGHPEARDVLKGACERGELQACLEILHPEGQYHGEGPAPPTPLSAEEYVAVREAACLHGGARQCRELAEACDPSSAIAIRLDEAACPTIPRRRDGLDVDGRACRAMGDRYRKGEGVPKDGAKAETYYRAGCYLWSKLSERDDDACVALAEMYERGEGVPADKDRALDIYAGLCSVSSKRCSRYRPCNSAGLCSSDGEGAQ